MFWVKINALPAAFVGDRSSLEKKPLPNKKYNYFLNNFRTVGRNNLKDSSVIPKILNQNRSHLRFIWIGLTSAVVVWVFESLIHFLFLNDGKILDTIPNVDPQAYWMRLTVLLMYVTIGVYVGIMISRRKQAEESIEAALAELNQIFQTSADGMRIVDKDFNTLRINETFARLTGASPDDAAGKKCYEVFPGSSCHTPGCSLTRILSGEEKIECEVRKERLDGIEIPCILTAKPYRGASGELLGMVEDFKDITERKQAEDALRESQKRYKTTLNAVPDMVYELAMDGTILYANQSALKVFGISMDHVGKMNILDLLDDREFETALKEINKIMETKETRHFEYNIHTPDGRMVPLEANAILQERTDQLPTTLSVARDITERKQVEDELRKHREHLEELVEERTAEIKSANKNLQREVIERKQVEYKVRILNEKLEDRVRERTTELEKAYEELKKLDSMKDTFLSSVSHELRTPLTSIRSFSEILLQYDDEDPETKKDFLEIIHRESNRLTRLINDFLDLSKIEAGWMVYNEEPVSLEEIITDVTRSQHQLLRERSLTLNLCLPRKLSNTFVDRDRIHQVITNLLNNAIKFSREGTEICIQVEEFESKRSGEYTEWIRVSVSDQGIGIEENDLEIIFDRFRQVTTDTLKDKPKGTGLGLPICKEIVGHYGGNLWVESQKGKGSTFYFTLPATSLSSEPAGEVRAETNETTGRRGKTVLVMDENPNVRRLLCSQFQSRGYRALEASDVSEVFEHVKQTPVDLITLDLIMPLMSGYDIVGLIREDPLTQDIPVLILSMVEDPKRGILLGANDFLKKPFKEDEMAEKIRAFLGEGERSVLVVDDDPGVSAMLRMQLEERNYLVDVAQDGEKALDYLRDHTPDLVILDVFMPGKNGYEVLSWIRNQPRTQNLPVIILTSQNLSDEQTKVFPLGMGAVTNKSREFSSLFETIDSTHLPFVDSSHSP